MMISESTWTGNLEYGIRKAGSRACVEWQCLQKTRWISSWTVVLAAMKERVIAVPDQMALPTFRTDEGAEIDSGQEQMI